MNLTLIQNNFTSGEVSPLLEGAIGTQRYLTGLRTCRNFLPIRHGGIRKRPGTMFAGNTSTDSKARLIEMTATSGAYYIIELTNLKARIWQGDFTIAGGGTPTVLTTPWTEAQLFELRYAVMKGVLYIAHPSHALRTIQLSGVTWTLGTPTFTGDRTFAATNKYAKAVFFHSGRLGLAGTNDEPNTILLSRSPLSATGVDRFTDFTMGTAADHAIYLQESDMNGTHIHWAIGQRRLVTGTDRSIWMDNGQLVTPATFDMNLVSYSGGEEIQPVLSEGLILYVGRGGTSIHALSYSEEGGGFSDFDISKDAEHFLSSPIVDMKVQGFPDPILWLVRADGILVSCTIDFKNGVLAWASHPMNGGAVVESIAIGPCSTEDVLWLSVKRGTSRSIEYMRFCNINSGAQEDFHFVDCGLSITNETATDTVSGLTHLEGKTVTAWADGAVLPDRIVDSGTVSYDTSFIKIHIGYHIDSEAETLRPEVPANGTSQGKQKRIEQASVRILRSLGGQIGASNTTGTKLLTWKAGTYLWGSVPNLYTGDLEAQISALLNADATLDLVHSEPAPFTLLAIIYKVAIMEA